MPAVGRIKWTVERTMSFLGELDMSFLKIKIEV